MLLCHPGRQALQPLGNLLFVSREQLGEGKQVCSFDHDLSRSWSDEELLSIPVERNLPRGRIRIVIRFHALLPSQELFGCSRRSTRFASTFTRILTRCRSKYTFQDSEESSRCIL